MIFKSNADKKNDKKRELYKICLISSISVKRSFSFWVQLVTINGSTGINGCILEVDRIWWIKATRESRILVAKHSQHLILVALTDRKIRPTTYKQLLPKMSNITKINGRKHKKSKLFKIKIQYHNLENTL